MAAEAANGVVLASGLSLRVAIHSECGKKHLQCQKQRDKHVEAADTKNYCKTERWIGIACSAKRSAKKKLKKEETKNGEEADRSGRIEEDDYRMSLGL